MSFSRISFHISDVFAFAWVPQNICLRNALAVHCKVDPFFFTAAHLTIILSAVVLESRNGRIKWIYRQAE
jgi:hypothetical protein